ncbi:MAG TPA: quinone-dependent dihydroorotate dehydrogenase [Microbacteriaceae bacterium]|nr:quinone-dependent dihydroorotate dehydrogenase [Microbacteriaceae bacterium]
MYPFIFRTVFARMDPERAHHLVFAFIRRLPWLGVGSLLCQFTGPRGIAVQALGLTFPSPFGLAAGFDKNGHAVRGLAALGFGHIEIGTLTPLAQPGNERPRMFRLVEDRALINRMGFNNDGVVAAARELVRLRSSGARLPIIGVNIGKNKLTPNEKAGDDYVAAATALGPLADYLVINVSSPNTPGLRSLQAVDELRPLLTATKRAAGTTPLLLKIAPDLADEDIRDIAALVLEAGLDGIIATNTTIARDGLRTDRARVDAAGAGGLSGAPLRERSLEVLRQLRALVPSDFVIISVGGVETPEDVIGRLDAGATLVQGYTGFVYQGPLWVRRINRALERRTFG